MTDAMTPTETARLWEDGKHLPRSLALIVQWLLESRATGRDMPVTAHLKAEKEAHELASSPTDIEEWADVAMCLVGVALHNEWTPEMLADALTAKYTKNLSRAWNRLPDGTWQHTTPAP